MNTLVSLPAERPHSRLLSRTASRVDWSEWQVGDQAPRVLLHVRSALRPRPPGGRPGLGPPALPFNLSHAPRGRREGGGGEDLSRRAAPMEHSGPRSWLLSERGSRLMVPVTFSVKRKGPALSRRWSSGPPDSACSRSSPRPGPAPPSSSVRSKPPLQFPKPTRRSRLPPPSRAGT